MKINKNKTKLKLSSELLDLDILKIMIKLNLKNISTDPNFIEFPNIDPLVLTYSEINLLDSKGVELSNIKAFVMMKENRLSDIVPSDFPDRLKPVLTLQNVTNYRPVLDAEDQIIYDEYIWTEQVIVKDEVGLPMMTDGDITKSFKELTSIELESGLWEIVYEELEHIDQIPRQEEYIEEILLPDPNGTTEEKTWLDIGFVYYEDEGNTKDCIVNLSNYNISTSQLTSINSDSKYTVLMYTEAKEFISLWNSTVI